MNSLVDKSFVRARGDDRFDLLVSVQVYAAEHLQTEGRYPGSGPQALAAAQEDTSPGSPRWGRFAPSKAAAPTSTTWWLRAGVRCPSAMATRPPTHSTAHERC